MNCVMLKLSLTPLPIIIKAVTKAEAAEVVASSEILIPTFSFILPLREKSMAHVSGIVCGLGQIVCIT